MKYLLLSLFLMACTVSLPVGRVTSAPEPPTAPPETVWPVKTVAEPKTSKPAPPRDHPVTTPADKMPPCEVTQDGGQQQVLETMDCLLEK